MRRALFAIIVPVVVTTVIAGLVAGCSARSAAQHSTGNGVNVDTARLRALKAHAGIAGCPASASGASARPGGLPAATLPCLGGGRSVDLAGLEGTPTVLNFWSQTCGPCRKESPLLQSVAQRANGAVRIIGVDFEDEQPELALAFADQLGLTYPQLADPNAVTRAPLRIVGLPMSFFVDASGRITHVQTGAISSRHRLQVMVRRYLGVDL